MKAATLKIEKKMYLLSTGGRQPAAWYLQGAGNARGNVILLCFKNAAKTGPKNTTSVRDDITGFIQQDSLVEYYTAGACLSKM